MCYKRAGVPNKFSRLYEANWLVQKQLDNSKGEVSKGMLKVPKNITPKRYSKIFAVLIIKPSQNIHAT